MRLAEFIIKYGVRGACCCGRCADAQPNPEQHQPLAEHSVDLTFFRVTAAEGATAEELRAAIEQEQPQYLDGREHSYLEIGGDLGDQGAALTLIGLGHVLGVWRALAPETIAPFLPDETKKKMAGIGMVVLKAGGTE